MREMDEYRGKEHARGVRDGRRVRAAARAGDDGEPIREQTKSQKTQICERWIE